ncbi:hypothetical protein ACQ86N_26270 [Puia sp. P3]|uniref:hypothetical protein n=1 Tax=Puia sp. P3 TaxID=3423952 RepID=UPI003D67907B
MKDALHEIESRTPFKFLARAEDVEQQRDITLAVKDQSRRKGPAAAFQRQEFAVQAGGGKYYSEEGCG